VIPPGGEGEIKATLKTEGREGPIKKRITVTSNDPDNPNLALNLEGEILVDISLKPRTVSFGQLGKGEGGKAEFEIVVTAPEKTKVVDVAVDDARFTAKKLADLAPGHTKWELAFSGAKELGRVAAQIIVKYESPEAAEARLSVRASVIGDLQYSSSLYFNKTETGFQEQELAFTSRSGKDVGIKKGQDPDGKLKLQIVTAKGKKAVLKATVADPEAAPVKPSRHAFTVETSDPDEPVVTIRYTITQRKPGRLPHMRDQDMKKGMGPVRDPRGRLDMMGEERKPRDVEEKGVQE